MSICIFSYYCWYVPLVDDTCFRLCICSCSHIRKIFLNFLKIFDSPCQNFNSVFPTLLQLHLKFVATMYVFLLFEFCQQSTQNQILHRSIPLSPYRRTNWGVHGGRGNRRSGFCPYFLVGGFFLKVVGNSILDLWNFFLRWEPGNRFENNSFAFVSKISAFVAEKATPR